MRLLPFVVDPMFPWSPPEVDHGPDAEALARLVAEVKDRHLVKRLADIAAFREDLMVALSQDQQAPRPEPSEEGGTPEPPLTPQPPAFHAVPSYVGSAPFTGRSVHLADLDLTQRRTHILAAALDGLAPGPQRLLSWISVLPGMVRWDTLVAINPFRPEPSAPIEPDLTPLGPVPYPVDYPPPRIDSGAPRLVSYADPPGPADEETDDDYWEQYRRRKMEWDAAAEQIRAHAEQATREQLAAWSVSEPVMRARAQLDAALKDLEARGLLWWDRSSNTYDLHPIIRAFVHDQLGETDRVQANDRIRDHFQALPPEDPHRATSVEDLTRAITIFRALVGANHVDDASELWAEFGEALLVDIGAYSTVIELLCPLATTGSPRVRGDLAIAYEVLHRYDEAISQEISTLAYRLQGEGVAEIERSLSRLMTCFWSSGAPAATDRCLDLREALAAAEGDEPHGSLVLDRAAQALSRGQAEHARELMGRAESIGPSGYFRYFPWFEDGLQRWRLYLALVADRSLTEAQLSDAAATARSWEFRRAVAGLRRELWGEPIPEPPTIDPASVKIPLEDEIRAFIAKLESER